jgi:hypothetical protein
MAGFRDRGPRRRSRHYVERPDRAKARQGVPWGRRSRSLVRNAGPVPRQDDPISPSQALRRAQTILRLRLNGGARRFRGRHAARPGFDTVERLLALVDMTYAWAIAQPLPLQIVLGLGLIAVLYFLYVLVSITAVALYATFFKP